MLSPESWGSWSCACLEWFDCLYDLVWHELEWRCAGLLQAGHGPLTLGVELPQCCHCGGAVLCQACGGEGLRCFPVLTFLDNLVQLLALRSSRDSSCSWGWLFLALLLPWCCKATASSQSNINSPFSHLSSLSLISLPWVGSEFFEGFPTGKMTLAHIWSRM